VQTLRQGRNASSVTDAVHSLLQRRLLLGDEGVVADDVVDFHSPRSETESSIVDQVSIQAVM
jgi:hypothetical protein